MQTTPLVAGLAVGAAAYGARFAVQAFNSWKSAGPRLRQFYKGGFQSEMSRREAALILGVRESAPEEKVRAGEREGAAGAARCLRCPLLALPAACPIMLQALPCQQSAPCPPLLWHTSYCADGACAAANPHHRRRCRPCRSRRLTAAS